MSGKIVVVPWPISVAAMRTRIRPSPVSSTEATEPMWTSPEPVNPAPCQPSASPIPDAVRAAPERNRPDGTSPEPRVPRPARAVARAEPLEVTGLDREPEDLLGGDALAEDLAGRRRVAGLVGVAPPDLGRAEAEPLGDPVQVGLDGELDLGRPEAAEGAVRRGVRAGRPGPDPDVRAAVRAARVECATREHDRRQGAVRAAVHDDLDVLGDERPVGRSRRSGGG